MKLQILNREDQCPHCNMFTLQFIDTDDEDGPRKMRCTFCKARYEEVDVDEDEAITPEAAEKFFEEQLRNAAPEAKAEKATAPKAKEAKKND